MAPRPPPAAGDANGEGGAVIDGVNGDDDELDEGEEEAEEEEGYENEEEGEGDEEDLDGSSGDEEEEEPRLKYQRMGGSVPTLLSGDAASCLTVAERIIALGTHDGTVHLLDYQGNQVKQFSAHGLTVNELSFDSEGEYIGSCSDDGSVVINSLYSDETAKFEYHRPMKSVALDPDYARKSTMQFAAGGLAGQLIFNTKVWLLGQRDQVLHSGEGPVHAIQWRTSLIAWANDFGVKVYDTATHQRLTYIERPRNSPSADVLQPHLVWQDDTILLIGWANYIKVAAVRTDNDGNRSSAGGGGGGRRGYGSKFMEIVAAFETEYYVSGLAPYGGSLVVLAYIPEVVAADGLVGAAAAAAGIGAEPSSSKFRSSAAPKGIQGYTQRPEVRILTWQNEELATDALSIHGYEHYKAKDYVLAHSPFSGSSSAGGQWAEGFEPLYYIVSPKDVVIGRPRDAEDHVAWLLQHGWHEKALEAVEAGTGRKELMDEVGSKYLDHLVLDRQYAQAAALCPKLLRGSAAAWERWVFHFAHLRQLPVLAPYVPISNPKLRETVYEVVLNALLTNPAYHSQLLKTIRRWPPNLYSHSAIITAVQLQLSTSLKTEALKQTLGELYVLDGNYSKALEIFVELGNPDVFQFIEDHDLRDDVHDKVVPLVRLDAKRTVSLLIQLSNKVTAAEVVSQLRKAKEDQRFLLHSYLHALFEKDPNASRDFHDLQVELYAEFEPRLLLPFLRSSQHFNLDKAYEVCTKAGLTRERVFLLGRMGNVKEAVGVIINELKDMEEAVKFIGAQHDEDLWEVLIDQSFKHPDMAGALLVHTVGNIDPLHLVHKVPKGLPIPHLRDRLVEIITDYRTETSLREDCQKILKADCVDLLVRYYDEARHAIRIGGVEEEDDEGAKGGQKEEEKKGEGKSGGQNALKPDWILRRTGSAFQRRIKTGGVSSSVGGSGRCCICLDPLALQNVAVVAFFCSHAYHVTCLIDPSGIRKSAAPEEKEESKKGGPGPGFQLAQSFANLYQTADDEEEVDNNSDSPPMRCILCSAAQKH